MIPLYLLATDSGRVLSIDDPAVDTDLGTIYQATIVSVDLTASGWSDLRRLIQTIHLQNTATVVVTPMSDGAFNPLLAKSYPVTAANGEEQQLIVPFAAHGSRHRIVVAVTQHEGSVELGAWSRHLIPRRVERSVNG